MKGLRRKIVIKRKKFVKGVMKITEEKEKRINVKATEGDAKAMKKKERK